MIDEVAVMVIALLVCHSGLAQSWKGFMRLVRATPGMRHVTGLDIEM